MGQILQILFEIGVALVLFGTLYSRIQHPTLRLPDGSEKERMHPAFYWPLFIVGCIFLVLYGFSIFS
jgi:hypothetical protein